MIGLVFKGLTIFESVKGVIVSDWHLKSVIVSDCYILKVRRWVALAQRVPRGLPAVDDRVHERNLGDRSLRRAAESCISLCPCKASGGKEGGTYRFAHHPLAPGHRPMCPVGRFARLVGLPQPLLLSTPS